jgi:hypothetical protein
MKVQLPLLALLFSANQLFAQNVGIGTTTPTYPLTVIAQDHKGIIQKDGTVEVGFFTSTTSAFLQTWSDHPLKFTTKNSSVQMTLLTNGNFGIGVDAPTNRLHVSGNAANSFNATIYGINTASVGNGILGVSNLVGTNGVQGSSTSGTGVYGYSSDYRAVYGATVDGTALYGYSSGGYGIQTVGKVKISGGNTNPSAGAVLTSVDASGNAVWSSPTQVAFKAYGMNSNQNVWPTNGYYRVHYGGEVFDMGNNFTLLVGAAAPTGTSSTFTAPVSGVYHFDLGSLLDVAGDNEEFDEAAIQLMLQRSGVADAILAEQAGMKAGQEAGISTLADHASFALSTDERLLAGDRVYVRLVQNSGANASIVYGLTNWFSGHLVFKE